MRQETSSNSNNWSESMAVVPPLVSVRDETANDSDKSWTVPDNEVWKITRMCSSFTSSATVGNRIITVREENAAGDVLQRLVSGKVQAASSTVSYCFLQGIFRETTVVNGSLQVPIPIDFYIPGGNVLRVLDSAAVDAAADDMVINFQYERLKV
ncbi:hypothetical protein N9917_02375 [Deltaproteobacteria bacterium]|nr:hypothetical protein [Deltaproteobacteria bacterium]